MTEDFREMLAALVAEEARFLVVGAHALAVHGVPRMTGDLDILVEADAANAQRVWRALARFGAPLGTLDLSVKDFATPAQVVQLGVAPYRIDLLTSISGVSFRDAWNSRVAGEMFGVRVPIIGRDALLRNKRAAGRPRDLLDAEALEGVGDGK